MPPTPPIRLAIVNDYELVVSGLAAALAPFSDQVTVVEIDSQLPVVSDVDILLYDTFGQAQGDALDIESLTVGSEARVVVFSWNTGPELVEQALAAGAVGYVAKSVSAEQLVATLVRMHAGEQLVQVTADDPEAASDRFGRWPGDRHGLSARESEVLALVCQGLSNEEIAERAFIAMNTLKTHIRSIYRKIGATSRSQAVAWGLTHGFRARPARRMPND